MNRVYLALGSNQGQPLHHAQNALAALDTIPGTTRVATSSFWRTPPYGTSLQADYLNAVIALDTTLPALALLDHTQHIEQQQGRIRGTDRFGPRTLDLDILLFGHLIVDSPRLTVPHYDMHNRAFMLLPLVEIAPDITFPDGTHAADLLAKLVDHGITPW